MPADCATPFIDNQKFGLRSHSILPTVGRALEHSVRRRGRLVAEHCLHITVAVVIVINTFCHQHTRSPRSQSTKHFRFNGIEFSRSVYSLWLSCTCTNKLFEKVNSRWNRTAAKSEMENRCGWVEVIEMIHTNANELHTPHGNCIKCSLLIAST